MAKKLIDFVKNKFPDALVDSHSRLGNDTVIIKPESLREIAQTLRDDPATKMNFLRAITAVDYMHRDPRFEVVYVLYSIEFKQMLTLRVLVDESNPVVDTLHGIYGSAHWSEREVWDMYGIRFNNHPDLRRVLLYEEFEGHPLRKDYAKQASQPRVELIAQERDSVEEFNVFVKNVDTTGSRDA